MTKKLSEMVQISERLSKSANVERDSQEFDFSSYLITERAQDVLRQIIRGMQRSRAGRAFSITGPYGTGKSSFALFLKALFAERSSHAYISAIQHLSEQAPSLRTDWESSRASIGADNSSPLRAFGTAKREPLVWTISKAMYAELRDEEANEIGLARIDLLDPQKSNIDATKLRKLILSVAQKRPIVILIDEFGKNLQSLGDAGAEGDPYLLQEIAEAAQGKNGLPVILLTMQHLAFDEYVSDLANVARREWSKIQGRFHDLAFVESDTQTHALIASAFSRPPSKFDKPISTWYDKNQDFVKGLVDPKLANLSYPLHPLTVAALPELCNRYGQNERTLFSFLAGDEPNSAKSLLAKIESRENQVDFVGLADLYDYFLASASSYIAVSNSASRWLEIELRLRDFKGRIEPFDEGVLKTIAVLNLVSSGGVLRASEENILSSGNNSPKSRLDIRKALERLARDSVVTYREFADEWRIWKGSDFDVRAAIEQARLRSQDLTTFDLVSEIEPNKHFIAGRSSQSSGTLRIFSSKMSDSSLGTQIFESVTDGIDGLISFQLDHSWQAADWPDDHIPVIVAEAKDPGLLRLKAIEVYATYSALNDAKGKTDEVAFNELNERLSSSRLQLNQEIIDQWDPKSSSWTLISKNRKFTLTNRRTISEILSDAVDLSYSKSPVLRNEMISRRDLTSQGAMARRILCEAIIRNPSAFRFGLSGYGPEVSMYSAIFERTGIHSQQADGSWLLAKPSDENWAFVWEEISAILQLSTENRLSLNVFYAALSKPPVGLKQGVIWLLIVAYIQSNLADIAVYEYGSLVLEMSDAVVERLLKNPGVFSIRLTGVTSGTRKQLISKFGEAWRFPDGPDVKFMTLIRNLSLIFRSLPPFVFNSKQSLSNSTRKLIDAFREASEPDELFFRDIPRAIDLPEIEVSKTKLSKSEMNEYVNRIVAAIQEAQSAYPELLNWIQTELARRFGCRGDLEEIRFELANQANRIEPSQLTAELQAVWHAFARINISNEDWLANCGMILAGGLPPKQWDDNSKNAFIVNITQISRQWLGLLAFDGNLGENLRVVSVLNSAGNQTSELIDLSLATDNSLGSEINELIGKLTSQGMSKNSAALAILGIVLEGIQSEAG